ncbi:MAG: hypothetical protein ACRBFS_01530 [Aureispira sp.]
MKEELKSSKIALEGVLENKILVSVEENDLQAAVDWLEEYRQIKKCLESSNLLHDYLHSVKDWNMYSRKSHAVNLAFIDLAIENGIDLNKIKEGRTILDLAIDNRNTVMDAFIQHLLKHYEPIAVKNAWLSKSSKFKQKYK